MRRTALALLALLTLCACGVGAQQAPEPISIPRPSAAGPESSAAPDAPRVTIWFVRGAGLEPAERPTDAPGIDAALAALVAGPSRAEVVGGLRTALSPQSLMPDRATTADPLVTVEVSREFTEVAGSNQLLATAQVVFTVTEFPGVQSVRIVTDGSPVEVPTDEGLTDEPVGRDDYASLGGDLSSPTPTPTPSPPSTPASEDPPALPPGSAAPSTPGRRVREGC